MNQTMNIQGNSGTLFNKEDDDWKDIGQVEYFQHLGLQEGPGIKDPGTLFLRFERQADKDIPSWIFNHFGTNLEFRLTVDEGKSSNSVVLSRS